MKKNQSGVSLISLVITIIVVIILAAVAFGSSTDTITNANYSTFKNNVGEVATLFTEKAVTLKGTNAMDRNEKKESQAYNYLAKGATLMEDPSGDLYLPRSLAESLACTQLSGDAMGEAIDFELPSIKVNTDKATGIEVSYFVTREGVVFVWPPYEYNNEFYISNDDMKVMSGDESIKADNVADTAKMYEAGFKFMVGNVEITTADYSTLATERAKLLPTATAAEVAAIPTVFYTDANGAETPKGLEADALYTNTINTAS